MTKHRGVTIKLDPEDGWYAQSGAASFGYCETREELVAEIDDHFAAEAEHYRDIDTPADTPSLPQPQL